jgi:hypothetical protein
MSPAGNWSKEIIGNFSKVSRRKQPVTTYIAASVALEGAVMDLHIGTIASRNSAALYTLHVPCRELERKCEIVLFAERAPMELKSSANESWHLPQAIAPSFVAKRVESKEHHPVKDRCMSPARN